MKQTREEKKRLESLFEKFLSKQELKSQPLKSKEKDLMKNAFFAGTKSYLDLFEKIQTRFKELDNSNAQNPGEYSDELARAVMDIRALMNQSFN